MQRPGSGRLFEHRLGCSGDVLVLALCYRTIENKLFAEAIDDVVEDIVSRSWGLGKVGGRTLASRYCSPRSDDDEIAGGGRKAKGIVFNAIVIAIPKQRR